MKKILIVWVVLTILCCLIYALTEPASARHHTHARCPNGKILIVHEGRCVAKASSAAREVYHRHATPAPRIARPVRTPKTHGLTYVKVIEAPADDATPPPSSCGDWSPSSYGWPDTWVTTGLKRGRWLLEG
jgi:hypothetical protein